MRLPKALVALFALTLWLLPAIAGPLENGVAAFLRGDYATALGLFQAGADLGDPAAQANLCFMYSGGYGAPRDLVEAFKWFTLAAEQISRVDPQFRNRSAIRQAIETRDSLAAILAPGEIAEGRRLAREWRPQAAF